MTDGNDWFDVLITLLNVAQTVLLAFLAAQGANRGERPRRAR